MPVKWSNYKINVPILACFHVYDDHHLDDGERDKMFTRGRVSNERYDSKSQMQLSRYTFSFRGDQ